MKEGKLLLRGMATADEAESAPEDHGYLDERSCLFTF